MTNTYSGGSIQRWVGWNREAGTTSLRLRVHKLLPGPEQGPRSKTVRSVGDLLVR